MDYQRITPISDTDKKLASSELVALTSVWKEKRGELEDSGEYKEFIKKLQREWAIETGIIERLYTWDRGVTEILIEQGIESTVIAHQSGMNRDQAENVKNIITDQYHIIDGLFAYIKNEEPFTEYFIRGMHSEFTNNQDYTDAVTPDGKYIQVKLDKGVYKKQSNNPKRPDGEIHAYCPPDIVQDEMSNLVLWYKEAEENGTPLEVLSAWVHHRFTQIHPFQDGNGRVARALASLTFLKGGLFPLVVRDKDRITYIEALEDADKGDLSALIKLFVKRQRDSILSALGIQQQVEQASHRDQIISSALDVLRNKYQAQHDKVNKIYDIASTLQSLALETLTPVSNSLSEQISKITPPRAMPFSSELTFSNNGEPQSHYFHHQIIKIANKFDYYANLDKYKSWIKVGIYTENRFEFVVSIHGYGHTNNGIMVASAFTSQRVQKDEGGTELINVTPAIPDLFQFNYAESEKDIKQRFSEWLESAVTIAIAEWKQTL